MEISLLALIAASYAFVAAVLWLLLYSIEAFPDTHDTNSEEIPPLVVVLCWPALAFFGVVKLAASLLGFVSRR